MNAKRRNAAARASRGQLRQTLDAQRTERRETLRASQNRHALAAPVTPITGVTPRKPRTRKGQEGWDVSPYYKTRVTIDSRWSATVSNRAV